MSAVAASHQPPGAASVDALLVAALAVVAPLTLHLPIWLSAVFVGAITWRYAARHGVRQPGRAVRWLLTAIGVVVVVRHHGTLLGPDAGVAMLVWFTGLKLFELGSRRDTMLAAFLLLLMLLGNFLYDSSLVVGVYTLVAVVCIVAALARLQQPLLSWADTYRLAGKLIGQALPVMVAAYLLFPRLPEPLWGTPGSSSQARTGMSDEMRPGSVSGLTQSYDVAFRAQFEGSPPPLNQLYWRVRVLWNSDGRVWRAGPPVYVREWVRPRGATVPYRLVLEPSEDRTLPVLDLPVAVPRGLRQRAGFVYEQPFRARERRTYEFGSVTRYETESQPSQQERATALAVTASQRVRDLATNFRNGARDENDIVRAALAYFREQPFYYTFEPPTLTRDPVDEFLFETRRGFCEHYAAAFVTLMRAAGIPSRVVIGYQGGVYNESGNYVIVRQAEAHAWAEVWLAGRGWVRVDPTAAVAPARVEYGIDAVRRLNEQGVPLTGDAVQRLLRSDWLERAALQLRLSWDYANMSWYYWINDYRRDRQARLLDRLGITNWSIAVLVVVVLQLVLLYALFQARAQRPRDVVLRLYQAYCRKLEAVGIARLSEEGPLALAERVSARRPDLRPGVEAITRLYVQLRYGRGAGAAELGQLARAVRAFRPRTLKT